MTEMKHDKFARMKYKNGESLFVNTEYITAIGFIKEQDKTVITVLGEGKEIYFPGDQTNKLLKEQQPKTGHWLKKMSSCPSAIAMGGSKISACDLCGGWGKKTFQYCPHCGAKMEKQP